MKPIEMPFLICLNSYLGRLRIPFGETSGDQALFEEQAEHEPNPIELQLNGADMTISPWAMCLFAQGNVAGAIGVYGDAIQLSPSAEAYSKLGIALEAYGESNSSSDRCLPIGVAARTSLREGSAKSTTSV